MSKQRRLDQAVTELFPNLSRRQAQKLCKSGRVTVNGKLSRAGQLVTESDQIEVAGDVAPVRVRPELANPNTGFRVIHEDASLIVAHKPSGMHSVRLTNEDPVTTADCLAAHCAATADASPDPRESGLVNRLDYYTAGLVVAAKNREAWMQLRAESSWIEKRYYALVEGELSQDSVVQSLFRNLQGGEKVEVLLPSQLTSEEVGEQNELAESRIFSRHVFKGITLVETVLRTGKRHQIRAHLAWLKHPIVGDSLYGSVLPLEQALALVLGKSETEDVSHKGFGLFAHQVTFLHPQAKTELKVTDNDSLISKIRQAAQA